MRYEIPLPRKGRILSYFLISDIHSLESSSSSLDIFFQHLERVDYFSRRVIILGDLFDFGAFRKGRGSDYSKWIKASHGVDDYFYPEYQKEMEWGNKFFDRLCKTAVEVIWLEGNHTVRIKEFLKECQMSQKYLFNFQRDLKLDDRKISFIPYPKFLDIGGIAFNHGYMHQKRYLEAHVKECGFRHLFMGHMHRSQHECFKSRYETVKAYSLSCMCDLEPDYMGGKPSLWTHGYGRIFIKSNSNFNFYNYDITDNQLVLEDGTILEGQNGKEKD